MRYQIYTTIEFEKDFKKCDNAIRKQIKKEINQLKTNPYLGKPLGYNFFREKKIENYRIYYLIFKEQIMIFLIAISNKKEQQQVINKIKKLIPFYQEEIRKKFNQ